MSLLIQEKKKTLKEATKEGRPQIESEINKLAHELVRLEKEMKAPAEKEKLD